MNNSRCSLGGLRGFGYFSWFWYHELPKLEKQAAEVQITEQIQLAFVIGIRRRDLRYNYLSVGL
jgi:hypothetical protein